MQAELRHELNRWRQEVIDDEGVDDAFRGVGVFPDACPVPTVGDWVQKHADDFDFKQFGVPGWYPTRTLEEWRKVRAMWEPWVFRPVDSNMKRPVIPFTEKPKNRR